MDEPEELKAAQATAKAERDKLKQAVAAAEAAHKSLAATAKNGHEAWAQAEAKADESLAKVVAAQAALTAFDAKAAAPA